MLFYRTVDIRNEIRKDGKLLHFTLFRYSESLIYIKNTLNEVLKNSAH